MINQAKRLSKLYEKLFSGCSERPVTEREFIFMALVTLDVIKFPERMSVALGDLVAGRGYYYQKKVLLPTWIGKYHVAFQIYYLIHEICHCIVGHKHTSLYKITEDHLLKLWGIRIVRRRVYPRKLYFKGNEILNIPNSLKDEEEISERIKAQAI